MKNPNAVALGRMGGLVRFEKKAQAARQNGQKGGSLCNARCVNCGRRLSRYNVCGVCKHCQRQGFRPGLQVAGGFQNETGSSSIDIVTRAKHSRANPTKHTAPPQNNRVT